MLDNGLFRAVPILLLALPALTLLATWADGSQRVAQLHPGILAATQLLASLTALLTESAERAEESAKQ